MNVKEIECVADTRNYTPKLLKSILVENFPGKPKRERATGK